VGGLVAVPIAALAGQGARQGGEAGEDRSNRSAPGDVEIDRCQRTDAGVEIEGTATNGSSKTSDYVIELRVVDANVNGRQLGTARAYVRDLPTGSTQKWDATADVNRYAEFNCGLADVRRTAS
jgi:hypothetical protein